MFTGGLHQAGLVGVYYPALLFYMSSRYYTEALCLQSEHSIDSLCDFSRIVMKCSDETAWGTHASGVSQFHATVEKQGMELWSSASLFPFTHFRASTQERVPLTMGASSHPNQCNQNNSPHGHAQEPDSVKITVHTICHTGQAVLPVPWLTFSAFLFLFLFFLAWASKAWNWTDWKSQEGKLNPLLKMKPGCR